MISQKRVSVGLMIAVIFLTGATMTLLISTTTASITNAQQTTAASKNVVRDSTTILLEGKSIPPKNFIHLYDSSVI